jgi:hypothetical protein
MVSEQQEGQKIILEKKSRIIKDQRQLSIRIPAEIVDKFNIDTKNDYFVWLVIQNKDTISLSGGLIKENDEKKNN